MKVSAEIQSYRKQKWSKRRLKTEITLLDGRRFCHHFSRSLCVCRDTDLHLCFQRS